MNARHRLERATNTKYTDAVVSDEMRSLTTRFNIAHSVSSIVNLAAVGAVVAHAIHLGVSHFLRLVGYGKVANHSIAQAQRCTSVLKSSQTKPL